MTTSLAQTPEALIDLFYWETLSRHRQSLRIANLILQQQGIDPIVPSSADTDLSVQLRMAVDQAQSEIKAQRLVAGDTSLPLLGTDDIAQLQDLVRLNIKPLNAQEAAVMETYLVQAGRQIMSYGHHAGGQYDDHYQYARQWIRCVGILAAQEDLTPEQVLASDRLVDEITRQCSSPDKLKRRLLQLKAFLMPTNSELGRRAGIDTTVIDEICQLEIKRIWD